MIQIVHNVFAFAHLRRKKIVDLMILNRKVVQTIVIVFLAVAFHSCTSEGSEEFIDYNIDTDGDGIFDSQEVLNGTDKNNPCDPAHDTTYTGYDPNNLLWQDGDCDGDGLNNVEELLADTNPYGEPEELRELAVPEFLPNLSELKLFKGNQSDFEYNDNVYEYSMSTPLFTDYAHKLRVVSIPDDTQMIYDGEGLLKFPENTIMAKTFYYLNDERDPTLGKKVIETRVLIKKEGVWLVRNYFWNEDQTDAVLDDDIHNVQIDWIDIEGNAKTVPYVVPPNNLCIQCHNKNDVIVPIGPKARVMNFEHNGKNLLQDFIDKGLLAGAPDVSEIPALPNWANESLPLEDRARAYLDVNCAHCHQTGGSYNSSFGDSFQFTFETPFEESNIYAERVAIKDRMGTKIPGYFMPLIGTSLKHDEGIELINTYVDSLE